MRALVCGGPEKLLLRLALIMDFALHSPRSPDDAKLKILRRRWTSRQTRTIFFCVLRDAIASRTWVKGGILVVCSEIRIKENFLFDLRMRLFGARLFDSSNYSRMLNV